LEISSLGTFESANICFSSFNEVSNLLSLAELRKRIPWKYV
jgi:hypothetical protein